MVSASMPSKRCWNTKKFDNKKILKVLEHRKSEDLCFVFSFYNLLKRKKDFFAFIFQELTITLVSMLFLYLLCQYFYDLFPWFFSSKRFFCFCFEKKNIFSHFRPWRWVCAAGRCQLEIKRKPSLQNVASSYERQKDKNFGHFS